MSALRRTKRIALSAVIGLLGVAVLLAFLIAHMQYLAARAAAEIQVHRAAHAVASQYSWIFHTSAQTLRRIEEATAGITLSNAKPHDIRGAVRDLPPGFQHSLYDAKGRLILSSAQNPSQIEVADRSYFLRVRAGEELVISPMVTERLTGDKVFILARRIERNGQFAGAATIAIPVASLGDFANVMSDTDQPTIALVAMDGMLIARYPPVNPLDLSNYRVLKEIKRAPHGYFASVSPADGVRRIVGYWRMEDWPVVAMVGQSEQSVFQAFRRGAMAELMLFLPLFGGIVALVLRLIRLQQRDERRERALLHEIARNDDLMKEIHHRVKNNLQTAMSLIRLERLAPEVKASLLGRLLAMAEVHKEMYDADFRDMVPARAYLTRLVANIAKGHGGGIVIHADIAAVELSGERAMQVGLLVNELVANAFKHAFAGRVEGQLEVRLSAATQPGWLRLVVSDDGPGLDLEQAAENMGSRLINTFVAQMGGHMEKRPSREDGRGLGVVIDFPAQVSP
ncbi:MAG: ATP-binding protein [Rhodobacteraceae bacterium]|nr:ATP-binding protein [Paracoccaceae bacterium]